MSWKLTKKLKETHLTPLSNPWSKSSSSSSTTPTPTPAATATTTTTVTPETSAPSSVASDTSSISSESTALSSVADSPAAKDAQNAPVSIPPASTADDHLRNTTPPDFATASGQSELGANESQTQPSTNKIKQGQLILSVYEAQKLSLSSDARRFLEGCRDQQKDQQVSGSVRPASASFGTSFGAKSYVTGWNRPKTSAGKGFDLFPTNHGRYSGEHLPYLVIDFEKNEITQAAQQGTPENPVFTEATRMTFDVSLRAEVFIAIYIRNPFQTAGDRSNDICLGTCKVRPRYDQSAAANGAAKSNAEQSPGFAEAIEHNGVGWVDLQEGTGSLKLSLEFVEKETGPLSLGNDFKLLKTIGRGSFGKVMLVEKLDTHRIYVVKAIKKKHIISRSEVTHTMAERIVLARINNPFIVPLKFSFQSPDKLFLILAFVNGGELFYHLQREHRFELNRARFYAAELLCALECLHGFNIIYRDLKPENILLDYSGHIVLCDFGLCKLDIKDGDRTNTFCGTPEYLAPELLYGHGYTKSVDWWTLGVLLYEMLTGLPPFYHEDVNTMYNKILHDPLQFPTDKRVMPPAAQDLLTKLLDRRPEHRLGAKGAGEIKAHPFFQGIDWRKLLQRKYEPTFKPVLDDALDTRNFDPEFTNEVPQESYAEAGELSTTMQQLFAGWSYRRPTAGVGGAGTGSLVNPEFANF